jgi:hypothetical protein
MISGHFRLDKVVRSGIDRSCERNARSGANFDPATAHTAAISDDG